MRRPNFNVPMGDSLLWVYEGQTQYWGFVLASRSGLWSDEQTRDALALVASRYQDNRPGFSWRNVEDTTNDPVIAARRPLAFRNYQMSEDYYSAGQLIWLAVDAKLRELTHERRSLDDFARAFFGGRRRQLEGQALHVRRRRRRAEFDRVIRLGEVPARSCRRERAADGRHCGVGLEARLYRQASDYQKTSEADSKSIDYSTSIGILVSTKDSKISDVRWNGPAFNAGITTSTTLIAVNGREFTPEKLR